MVDVQHTEEYVNVSAIAEEFVGSTVKDNTEEWLLDSGATCGVTHDKTQSSSLKSFQHSSKSLDFLLDRLQRSHEIIVVE